MDLGWIYFLKLDQIIEKLDRLADDQCVFARKPWSRDSGAIVAPLAENFQVPTNVSTLGMDYFLEVHVVKEVLEVLGDRNLSKEDRLKLLIFYAENDAYPDWVYT